MSESFARPSSPFAVKYLPQELAEAHLVDVKQLSKGLCSYPIGGKLMYATTENFVGRIVDGYNKNAQDIFLLTTEAGKSLCAVQNEVNKLNLSLYIYDAYRPHRAVKDFYHWCHTPHYSEVELLRKEIHYPYLKNKIDIVKGGYLADTLSKHNFGFAVDLGLFDLQSQQLLNMGAVFDYFDEKSHHTARAQDIGQEAFNNRQLLISAMQGHGFLPYSNEFWHYDYYKKEVDMPINLEIAEKYRGLNVDNCVEL